MWGSLRASVSLLRLSEWAPQSKRTVFILKRKHPVRLNKLGAVFPKKFLDRENFYELDEDTDSQKQPPLEVVLTEDVAGVGMRGDKIEMNMYAAYRDLLLPKLAVYVNSPEAKKILKVVQERQYSSIYSRFVENYLSGHAVKVIMNYDTPWTLQPWHIKIGLRQIGVLTSDDCISIPKEITGPNLEIENKDFLIYITMNKSEKFPVRCRIYHWSSEDATLNQKLMDLNSESEVLFPDEKEKIQSLMAVEKEIKKMEQLKNTIQKKTKKTKRRPK